MFDLATCKIHGKEPSLIINHPPTPLQLDTCNTNGMVPPTLLHTMA